MVYFDKGVLMNKKDGYRQNIHDYTKMSNINIDGKFLYERIFDYNTKNKSFLNVHKMLKESGVKNHSEHLQLFDKRLLGVDPHSPNIPENVRIMIDAEIRRNVWYYLREVVRIPTGTEMTFFDLNLASFTGTFLMTRRQNFFYELPRQVGKTFLLTTILGWILEFGGTRINMANIHHSAGPALKNINAIKDSLENIPPWLHYHKKDVHKLDKKTNKLKIKDVVGHSDNSRTLKNRVFQNNIETVVVGNSMAGADKAGRGSTRHVYFIDEISHIKNNFVAFGALNQSTTESRLYAKKAGFLHGIWLLGTPGDLRTSHGRWMYENIKKNYIPIDLDKMFIFDMITEELEDYINENSISNFWHVKFDWDVLGYDEQWFFEKNRNEEVNVINREVLLKWEQQTHDNPFTRAELASLDTNSRNKKQKVHKIDDFNSFYYYPEEGEISDDLVSFLAFNFKSGVVMGVDVAAGTGGDYSTIAMVDSKTLRPIVTYRNNTIDIDDFAMLIAFITESIFIKHGIKLAIGVERTGVGQGLISRLKKMESIRQYLIAYPISESKMKDLNRPIELLIQGNRLEYGLNITPGIRKIFTESLLKNLVKKHTKVYSIPILVREIRGLVVKKVLDKIRIEHGLESHDDMIFATLHAYFPLYYHQDILKSMHRIEVNPNEWIISDGVQIISGNTANKRILVQYYTDKNGKFGVRYLDTKENKYVNEETAMEIERLGNDTPSVISNETKKLLEEEIAKPKKSNGYDFEINEGDGILALYPDEDPSMFIQKSEDNHNDRELRNLYNIFGTRR